MTYNEMRLDRFLRNKLGKIPQSLIEKSLRSGKVKINKKKIKSSFKVKTNGAMPSSAGTPLTLYTVPSSTTTVVIGLTLCNIHTTTVTADVQLVSDTSDTETNETVLLIKDVSIPAGASLELLTGGKVVVQATDIIKIDCSVTAKIDATLSILEIT